MPVPQTLQFPLSSPSHRHQSESLHIWSQNIPELSTAETESCIWTLKDIHRLLEPWDVLPGLSHLCWTNLRWEVIAYALSLSSSSVGCQPGQVIGTTMLPRFPGETIRAGLPFTVVSLPGGIRNGQDDKISHHFTLLANMLLSAEVSSVHLP